MKKPVIKKKAKTTKKQANMLNAIVATPIPSAPPKSVSAQAKKTKKRKG